ncbi:hypothetical protein [Porphyromonas somerae]|uniref:hypothetical protein n=1 Tax=Porphyromonas somerae TaxID=322095 RepID=UPI002A813BCE|nr:hypothetical protein [Porphyromonas somerae]MDY3884726.1 hypothetical protein [Porphyromonas somerae]
MKWWLVVIASCLMLMSCSSSKQVQAQKIELARGVEIRQDSTTHRWVVNRVTLYDAGLVKQVEESEQHEASIVTRIERDTLYINKVDTLYLEKEAPTQLAKEASRAINRFAILLIFVLTIACSLVVYKVCKKPLFRG